MERGDEEDWGGLWLTFQYFNISVFYIISDVMEDQELEIVQRKQTIRNQDN